MMLSSEPGRPAQLVSERRQLWEALAEHMPLGVSIWRLDHSDDLAECRRGGRGER